MFLRILVCFSVLALSLVNGLVTSPFKSNIIWEQDQDVDPFSQVKFTVALKLQNVNRMKDDFKAITTPKSPRYGKYMNAFELNEAYGLSRSDKMRVFKFLSEIPYSKVEMRAAHSDFITVSAPAKAIEEKLNTKLRWHRHTHGITLKRAVRAVESLSIPSDISDLISFMSLNSPITHAKPKTSVRERMRQQASAEDLRGVDLTASAASLVNVTRGNNEAIIQFSVTCGDGSPNQASPPCSNLAPDLVPDISVSVNQYKYIDSSTPPLQLNTNPMTFEVSTPQVSCYHYRSLSPCSTSGDSKPCTCYAKLSPLPKYRQLRASVSASFPGSLSPPLSLGSSKLFALTDVATAPFLSELYQIDPNTRVLSKSNQSVAEFYGEFYSNDDLAQFLSLSGLPAASIPDKNVFGDLANNQSQPGGEAQLDVEYIMALAPGAETYFYSFSDLNPYSEENEGFLAWLEEVDAEPYPPLVQSVSYGDIERVVFDVNDPAAYQYGERCDQEFLQMGLRGISVLFASGDDGVADYPIAYDPNACDLSSPSWPASSPYVTTVGATQLSDQYQPVCQDNYYYPRDLPASQLLNVQCSGTAEVVCSSTLGGVITSGGGFSNVSPRPEWQQQAVQGYLDQTSVPLPPNWYFNPQGRAYPDISTYGSNYFIYLDGELTRESGTSASTPVMAAMVTLWNDLRLSYGLPPMGFLNPFLYSAALSSPEAFHDVTTGNIACGAGGSVETVPCCDLSFEAAPGWDATTGLGSPNFQVLSNLVLNPDVLFPSIPASSAITVSSSSSGSSSSSDSPSPQTQSLAVGSLVISLITFLFSLVNLWRVKMSN